MPDRLRAEASAFTAALTQPDALATYRLIVADGWRHPALARLFEQSGLGVLRGRVASILAVAGKPRRELAALEDSDRQTKFAAQIEHAIRFATAD